MATADTLSVEVLAPSRVLTRTTARQVKAPGVMGEMGILPGHAPMVAELDCGELAIEGDAGATVRYFVAGGYVEVLDNSVRVLVDVIEKPEEIDVERAKQSRLRAAGRLSQKEADIDMQRAIRALRRADLRLAFIEGLANLRMG